MLFVRRRWMGIFALVSLVVYYLWSFRKPQSPFQFSKDEGVFPISAYHEPGRNMVRIFTLKHTEAHPRIYCSFIKYTSSMSSGQETKPTATHSRTGRWFAFDALLEFKGNYRGYVMFCDMPKEILPIQPDRSISIRLYPNKSKKTYIQLPVRVGRDPKNRELKKHRISMCMTPWFQTEGFTAPFIVEFIELQRLLGVTQLVIYLTEEPHLQVKSVLDLYVTPENNSALNRTFELKIVPWILPITNASQSTWYFDQILSFNDCIHRVANETDYVYFGDFDEIMLPNQRLHSKQTGIPTWHELIDAAQNSTWYNEYPTLCFPSYYFPPPKNLSTERSIYDRTNATVEAYPERKKCLIRPTQVEEVYVHWPTRPDRFRMSSDLAVIYHYRNCLRKNYDACGLDTKYRSNYGLRPYRQLVKQKVNSQLERLKKFKHIMKGHFNYK